MYLTVIFRGETSNRILPSNLRGIVLHLLLTAL